MKTIKTVIFEREEREVFEHLSGAAYVCFPDPQTQEKQPGVRREKTSARNEDAQAHALLRRMSEDPSPIDHRYLERVHAVMSKMVSILEVESDPKHWTDLCEIVPREPLPEGVEEVSVSFITPEVLPRIIEMIVDARRAWLESARDALFLVQQALVFATPYQTEAEEMAEIA